MKIFELFIDIGPCNDTANQATKLAPPAAGSKVQYDFLHEIALFEHCFSYNWNVMKGYHYLMRISLMLNILVQYSEWFIEVIKALGKP
jgi:hypothetical protein